MPAPSRGHRAQGGMTRTHSRTNSGGSSKIGLNLQFTQKDVPPPRLPDKSKKSAHFNHEPTARTGTISRIGSTHRLPSREQIAPAQLRRAPPPVAARTKDGKHRAGFTISSPSEGDDDEWVSSESGNATPNAGQSDSEAEEIKTPVEPTKPRLPPSAMQVNGFHKEDVVTPKAEVSASQTTVYDAPTIDAFNHEPVRWCITATAPTDSWSLVWSGGSVRGKARSPGTLDHGLLRRCAGSVIVRIIANQPSCGLTDEHSHRLTQSLIVAHVIRSP
ncbi:hypothetical protein EVJ58_g7755 [Rhodofomes roseus]|uniref:Uncharacterized protein n=1 Tax=Rhodofomes roseus TaxID=34475 RepID=A0A4Y9Y2U4_9APHY|nr:hypothetical protein EVJ58_g7755 [Rhodofomes roseus]